MRWGYLIAVLLCAAQACALAPAYVARAQDPGSLSRPPTEDEAPAAAQPLPVPPEQAAQQPSVDPVVAIIRAKLTDPSLRKGANEEDLTALEALYAARVGGPLWMTDMGFSARGQAAIFEIERADDWGLAASSFDLPDAEALPSSKEAEALAELKLDLAILKYARYARGGRFDPSTISALFDVVPPVRDPKLVLAAIEAAPSPDLYLRSLQPKHEQFMRLHQALIRARAGEGNGGKPLSERDIRKIIINMERWRWMPEDLGNLYVWNNTPEFMVYVVKDGKPIYGDRILVGTLAYATPVFTADMKTIVFNPEWNAPETVVKENLLPPLREGNLSILKVHKLFVSLNGTPVDPTRVDWARVNIMAYTFSQRAGPENVLGKIKFMFPNKHTVYMHDTLAYRKKYFQKPMRAIGHECVRMERPENFAEALLAQDQGWSSSQVKDLWDNAVNKPVAIEHTIPVHMVYFTAVVDDSGKVASFGDLYGLDNKMATAMFGSAEGFPAPPPESRLSEEEADAQAATPGSSRQSRTATSGNDIAGSLSFIDN